MTGWQEQLVALGTLIGVTALVLLAAELFGRRRRWIARRIGELASSANHRAGGAGDAAAQPRLLSSLVLRLARPLAPVEFSKRAKLQSRLQHAGLHQPSALYVFLALRLACMALPLLAAVGCVLGGWLPPGRAALVGGVGGAVGMLIPGWWLDRRKKRRQVELARSLPDFLDLLVTCVSGGLSMDAALRRVTGELRHAHAGLAAEMERVQKEIDLGATADVALHNLADRSDIDAIRSLGTFMKQARKLGTSISDALRMHAETLRNQRELRAEELAHKAAVKVLFPTLLLIFPTVFVVLAGPAVIQLSEKFSQNSPQAISGLNP